MKLWTDATCHTKVHFWVFDAVIELYMVFFSSSSSSSFFVSSSSSMLPIHRYGTVCHRVRIVGGGVTPKSCIRAIIILFEWKSALNFNPWAKFQTFRHLTPSTFRSILILVCHPMSRRRPYSKYSNCSLIDWKLTYSPSPFRMSLSVSPKTAFGVLFLIVVFCFILFSRLVVSFALVTDLFLGWCSPTKIIKLQNYDYPGSIR